MEILYPDVIGSGGAPKRIMKPRRRTDGQPCDEDMPGTGVLNLQPESANAQQALESPGPARSSLSQTPTGSATGSVTQSKPNSATIPPRTTPTQPSALTPPDESASQAKKRVLPPAAQPDGAYGTTPPPSASKSGSALPDSASSPEKRQRTSIQGDSVPIITASSSNSLHPVIVSDSPSIPQLPPPVTQTTSQAAGSDSCPSGLSKPSSGQRWCEMALEQFFKDFADEDMDLQIRIAEDVLVNESKALVYCKMPWCVKQHWIRRLDETFRKTA